MESTMVPSQVRMHDLVHDMALWITSLSSSSSTSQHMVRAWAALKEPLPNDLWKGKKRISLAGNKITRLSFKPECPDLVTLFLGSNPLISFHTSFFQAMPKLTTLDLSQTAIESLPKSIGSLSNLRALNLRHCSQLRDIQHLVKLSSLIFLDLSHSGLSGLPPEMKSLSLLRSLNLSSTMNLFTIPCKVISAFLKMEELLLYRTHINWSMQGEEATLDEVASLRYLQSLKVEIPNIDCIRESLFQKLLLTLECFEITIGMHGGCLHQRTIGKRKTLYVYESGSCCNGVKAMTTHAEVVFLVGNEVRHASELVGGSKILTSIDIYECNEMESVIHWRQIECDDALQNLEIISLYWLPRLKAIYEGEALKKTNKLREICIVGCNKLKFLFTLEMAKHLYHLEHLDVGQCNDLEGLIEGNELPPQYYLLPKLHTLELKYLPNLADVEVYTLQVRRLYLEGLPKIEKLFKGEASAKLENLSVKKCDNLKNIFPSKSLVKNLKCVKYLEMSNCKGLEDIVAGDELLQQRILLPKLQILYLFELPNLRSIIKCATLTLPSIEVFHDYGCPNLLLPICAKIAELCMRQQRRHKKTHNKNSLPHLSVQCCENLNKRGNKHVIMT